MNKKDIVYSFLIAVGIGLALWAKFSVPKIAYVRSAVVLVGYMGMKEARKITENKMRQWQSNIDTLSFDFQRSVNEYETVFARLSLKEKSEKESILRSKQDKLEQYKMVIEEKVQEENDKATQGVLNQVNSFIKEYSEQEGYDIILGVTHSGNILYGTDATDVTEEILQGLNESYKGNE